MPKILDKMFLALILIYGLVFVHFVTAIASTEVTVNSKPDIPEFTLKLFDTSYDIPSTNSTDPFNGQQITRQASHVESKTIEIIIKNVPFTPLTVKDANNNSFTANFFYNLRWKGHFEPEQGWREVFGPNFGYLRPNSGSTTIYEVKGDVNEGAYNFPEWSCTIPTDALIDIQVEALIGYSSTPLVFTGQASGWSSTQTISLNASAPIMSPTAPVASPTPTVMVSINPTPSTSAPSEATPTQSVILSNRSLNPHENAVTILLLCLIAILLTSIAIVYLFKAKKGDLKK